VDYNVCILIHQYKHMTDSILCWVRLAADKRSDISVRFQVLTATSMKMTSRMLRPVVWQKLTDMTRGAYCLHHQNDLFFRKTLKTDVWRMVPHLTACASMARVNKAEDSTEGCVFMSGYTRWVADSWFIQRRFINCTGCSPPAIGTQLNYRDLKYATLFTLHLISTL
jgi:hypothetical protein